MLNETLKTDKAAALAAWRIYFALAVLQTCLALALIFHTRSEESAGLMFGLSSVRLVVALGLATVLALFVWLLLETWIRPQAFEKRWGQVAASLGRRGLWNLVIVLCSAVFLLGLISISQLTSVEEPFTRDFFDRLSPLLIWLTGLSGQTVIALFILRHGRQVLSLRPHGRLFYFLVLAFAAIFLGWSWVASTVIPAESQRVGWNVLGVPVVEWQVFVAWLAGMLMLAALAWVDGSGSRPAWVKRFALRWLDLLVIALIWLSAVIAWQKIPLSPSWFLTEPVAPNYEYYPSSDALAYDAMAQSAMVGEGYRFYGLLYARRPLLAMHLTILHLLGGQGYEREVFLQILILAFIPVLVYWLTRALHNRVSAVIAASLIIFREANSIWLTARITTSHVKLLMADLPTMLMTVLFVLLSILWLQNIAERKLLALICGGSLGLVMLIRPEAIVYALPLLLISGLILWPERRGRLWLQSSLVFGLGLLLVISPWIWRNYAVTGEIYFDNPLHSSSLIQQRFQQAPEKPPALPDSSEASPDGTPNSQAVSTTMVSLPAYTTLQMLYAPVPTPSTTDNGPMPSVNRAFGQVLDDPAVIAQASLAHYLNSQVQTFLILPTAFRLPESLIAWIGNRSSEKLWQDCCGLLSYIRRVPYWRQWDGRFPASTWPLLALNLFLIAYGMNEAWKRKRWPGVTPLVLALTYLAANAVFRNSGGRYILPIDWIILVYFSIGLAQLSMAVLGYLRGSPLVENLPGVVTPLRDPPAPLLRSQRFYLAVLVLFLLGSASPALEASFPTRYDIAKREAMVTALIHSDKLSSSQRNDIYTLLSRGGIAFAGRAMYPRFFAPNAGDPGVGKKYPFSPKPYPRIGFYLAGSQNTTMVLPIDGEPASFPNAQDVLIVGCNPRDILLVARFSSEGNIDEIYLRSFLPARLRCPLPAIPETEN